jgi:hypothetical protein
MAGRGKVACSSVAVSRQVREIAGLAYTSIRQRGATTKMNNPHYAAARGERVALPLAQEHPAYHGW